jgi:hypothetical protein
MRLSSLFCLVYELLMCYCFPEDHNNRAHRWKTGEVAALRKPASSGMLG